MQLSARPSSNESVRVSDLFALAKLPSYLPKTVLPSRFSTGGKKDRRCGITSLCMLAARPGEVSNHTALRTHDLCWLQEAAERMLPQVSSLHKH